DYSDLKERTVRLLDDVGAIEALETVLRYDRAYGGGALLLGADDGLDMSEPLDLERVKELLYVTALEPTEIVPSRAYSDPSDARTYGRTSHYALVPSITLTGDPLG